MSYHSYSYTNTRARLDEISMLEPDWNSYGARAIEKGAIEAARLALDALERAGVPAPTVVPTTPGGVQIEWGDVEVEFLAGEKPTFVADLQNWQAWRTATEVLLALRTIL